MSALLVNITQITAAEIPALVALNNEFQAETSLLSTDSFAALVEASFFARTAGDTLGFLLAVASTTEFDNANFRWFSERFDAFVYVDRIVVAAQAQGTGAGRALYEALFAAASAQGFKRIACEVNAVPPNPGSDAFHARMGFSVLDSVALPDRGKTVRYMIRELE